jgi:nucleoside-diphosphate-sugar epimerase
MRALILGGCGFVGRHLVHACKQRDWHVDVVDNLSTGIKPEQWMSGLAWPDNCYYNDVRRIGVATPTNRYDLIFHCAAVVGGRLKIEGDPLAVAIDLAIDSEFFSWAARLDPQPKRVVYFSSSAVYPVELQTRQMNCAPAESLVSFDTTRIGRPDLTYGFSKLAGEYLAGIAAKQYGLPVVIYRPFSGYGEDQDLSYPFPALVQKVLRANDTAVSIWGSGEQRRDFIHIDDVIEAVFATMDALEPGHVLNLGSGVGTSFTELVDTICRVLHKRVTSTVDPSKPEGVFSRVADTLKLGRFYTPKISLEAGIRRVAAHLDRTRESV